jgi:LysR family transcriptional regulator, glycine cleavage system transcriptional activator
MSDTQLPPLAAVRVFEAAARLMSFTRAAAELGMTQAAVSYQIKLLEERLGEPLFLRRPRDLALTEAGEHLTPRVRESFDLLRETFAGFETREQSTLTINTMHTFAAQWLAPRLGVFQLMHPNIAVRLETTARVVDFAREEVDVVVRSGHGSWPGLTAIKLVDVRFTPMLSPKLAASVGGINDPRDILKLPLIEPKDPWWVQWFNEYGLPLEFLAQQTAPSLNMQALDANAAMAGQGVALLTPAFYTQELADGRLLQPFEKVLGEGSSYWLAFQESRRNVKKIKTFRDWVVAEARNSGEGP